MSELEPTPLYATLASQLREQLHSSEPVNALGLAQTLRSLQRIGLKITDIELLIERIRRQTDSKQSEENYTSPSYDDASLAALDLIHGTRNGLSWTSATTAADALHRELQLEEVVDAIPDALAAGDLVPPRGALFVPRAKAAEIAQNLMKMLADDTYTPTEAYFARVPKSAFTSRPAALMAYPDRAFLEALSRRLSSELNGILPDAVVWPRGVPEVAVTPHNDIERWISMSDHRYFARCDIEGFYEYIDHAILAKIAQEFIGVSNDYCIALESLLDTVMESTRGLPQGPTASDPLASLYLAPLDLELQRRGWDFRRLQDDFWIGAATYDAAKDRLQTIEELLREFGMRLNGNKTAVLKKMTAIVQMGDFVEYKEDDDQTPPTASAVREAVEILEELTSAQESDGESREQHTPEARVRESIITLVRASDVAISDSSMRHIMQWYPRLTPQIVRLLCSRPNPDQFRDFVETEIQGHPSQAWVNAWLISIPLLAEEHSPRLVELAAKQSRSGHPLVRSSALRVLMNAGIGTAAELMAMNPGLPEALWREFMAEAELGADLLPQAAQLPN